MVDTELQEQINQTLSGFMSNAEVRLRDKLSALLPALDLLEKRIAPRADDATVRYIGDVRKAAFGILRAAGNMGDYARYVRNYSQSEPSRINLSELVTTMLREVSALALHKEITFSLECRELPFYAVADKGQIEKLLYHLLSNAVLYGEKNVTVELKRSDGHVILTVTNTGGVIEGETLAVLYTGYSKFIDVKAGKLGLGLPIALAIACQNGGTMAVTSDVKNGTSVTVSLPDLLTGEEPLEMENAFFSEDGGYLKTLVAMSDFPGNSKIYSKLNDKDEGGKCTISTQ
ncbi:MAG: HAMP domain-containing histidine kinase [Oscillospiraceae bacterium]|jgi:signal transduction histidine kinase|nr:HAMP domain-containing histidine kinase [Oscillospiraceae bacterium]